MATSQYHQFGFSDGLRHSHNAFQFHPHSDTTQYGTGTAINNLNTSTNFYQPASGQDSRYNFQPQDQTTFSHQYFNKNTNFQVPLGTNLFPASNVLNNQNPSCLKSSNWYDHAKSNKRVKRRKRVRHTSDESCFSSSPASPLPVQYSVNGYDLPPTPQSLNPPTPYSPYHTASSYESPQTPSYPMTESRLMTYEMLQTDSRSENYSQASANYEYLRNEKFSAPDPSASHYMLNDSSHFELSSYLQAIENDENVMLNVPTNYLSEDVTHNLHNSTLTFASSEDPSSSTSFKDLVDITVTSQSQGSLPSISCFNTKMIGSNPINNIYDNSQCSKKDLINHQPLFKNTIDSCLISNNCSRICSPKNDLPSEETIKNLLPKNSGNETSLRKKLLSSLNVNNHSTILESRTNIQTNIREKITKALNATFTNEIQDVSKNHSYLVEAETNDEATDVFHFRLSIKLNSDTNLEEPKNKPILTTKTEKKICFTCPTRDCHYKTKDHGALFVIPSNVELASILNSTFDELIKQKIVFNDEKICLLFRYFQHTIKQSLTEGEESCYLVESLMCKKCKKEFVFESMENLASTLSMHMLQCSILPYPFIINSTNDSCYVCVLCDQRILAVKSGTDLTEALSRHFDEFSQQHRRRLASFRQVCREINQINLKCSNCRQSYVPDDRLPIWMTQATCLKCLYWRQKSIKDLDKSSVVLCSVCRKGKFGYKSDEKPSMMCTDCWPILSNFFSNEYIVDDEGGRELKTAKDQFWNAFRKIFEKKLKPSLSNSTTFNPQPCLNLKGSSLETIDNIELLSTSSGFTYSTGKIDSFKEHKTPKTVIRSSKRKSSSLPLKRTPNKPRNRSSKGRLPIAIVSPEPRQVLPGSTASSSAALKLNSDKNGPILN